MLRMGNYLDTKYISRRVRATNYLSVAQLFLQNNFLTEMNLIQDDIKPRLLGHWGTCPGINIAYSCTKEYFKDNKDFTFVLGPGHGFPALQANIFLDGDLEKVDPKATHTEEGIAYLCKNFSWPGGFPSHASPVTPNVICEGGELGYALATSYGFALGHPEKIIVTLLGDGELETATALSSLNLNKIIAGPNNGKVLPILHLNGYKISGPTITGRKSQRELAEMIRGFGFVPLVVEAQDDYDDVIEGIVDSFGEALDQATKLFKKGEHPFIVLRTDKGLTGPEYLGDAKIAGNCKAHQIPLPNAKTNREELQILENWLKSYNFAELFDKEKGFTL